VCGLLVRPKQPQSHNSQRHLCLGKSDNLMSDQSSMWMFGIVLCLYIKKTGKHNNNNSGFNLIGLKKYINK